MNIEKIKQDPFYSSLYEILGEQGIEEAGYFEDTRAENETIDYALNTLCTPLTSTIGDYGLSDEEKPCILLTTGSFCPIHQGHLDMLVNSRDYLKSIGYDVLQVYVSAGHDEYINYKNKDKAIPIHHRNKLIQELINKNSLNNWISVDPWEGVFNRVAINFTEVIERLSQYIKKYIKKEIPIFFVCGADNARFSLSFIQKGNCIVVGRPNSKDKHTDYLFRTSAYRDRIHFIEGENTLSSTKLRDSFDYEALKDKKDLKLRVEEETLETLILIELLKPSFEEIKLVKVEDQLKTVLKLSKQFELISLDPLLPCDNNLEISRLYDHFGLNKIGYTNRPSSSQLNRQVKNISLYQDYMLFDDDICSGGTIKYAKELLENHNIKGVVTLETNLNDNFGEVLDARDFFLFEPLGGLVIDLPFYGWGETRVPYIYPFVCPYNRGSIKNPLEFSIQVWELNFEFFKETDFQLKDFPHLQIFKFMEFHNEDLMSYICEFFIKYLVKLR